MSPEFGISGWCVRACNSSDQSRHLCQGQRDVYEQADADLSQRRLDITLEWIMHRIADEERRVHLSAHQPLERSYHHYHQGRLTAYQLMRMQLV